MDIKQIKIPIKTRLFYFFVFGVFAYKTLVLVKKLEFAGKDVSVFKKKLYKYLILVRIGIFTLSLLLVGLLFYLFIAHYVDSANDNYWEGIFKILYANILLAIFWPFLILIYAGIFIFLTAFFDAPYCLFIEFKYLKKLE